MEAHAQAAEQATGPIAEYHDRERWLLERHRQGVGSSEVPIILGVDPFGRSEADLQRKKLAAIDEGRLLDVPDSDAMLRGRLFEDDAVELWQMRAERGRNVRKVPLRSHPEVPLLSSADRLALREGELPTAPLEAKVPGWRQFKVIDEGGLSDYMNVQGQVHALVHVHPGTEWVVMRADPIAVRGFFVEADAGFGAIIEDRVAAWWNRHIIDREPAPELPAGEPLVDLSKLPKVEGRVVQLDDEEDRAFVSRMIEARDLRDESKALYDGMVAEIKDGRLPIGVFETDRARLYHAVRGGGTRLKVSDTDLAQLIDPLRLQAHIMALFESEGIAGPVEWLAQIAEEIRVDPQHYHVPKAEYQEVKLYELKASGF